MASAWKEIWSVGTGRNRHYCGIARTEDGHAVDVMRGDTCLESETYLTLQQAEQAAEANRRRYVRSARESAERPAADSAHA